MTQKLFHRMSQKTGMVPGTLVHVGERPTHPVRITVMDYGPDGCREHEAGSVEECLRYRASDSVTWINVDGVHQAGVIQGFGDTFDLHPLLLEDVMHTEQRPKAELFDEHVYVVLRMLYDPDEADDEIEVESEQISIVLGPGWVLTFQEEAGDIFDPVRERIRRGKGRVRKMGADYLAYSLIDVVVDKYFSVLERFGDHLEHLDAKLLDSPDEDVLFEIRDVKRAMIQVRRTVWPVRDALNVLLRGESRLFKKATLVYLRDVYDHTVQVVDMTETMRELMGGMMDLYMTTLSNRTNDIMKVLTIMASIFIPLTFIAGVYGMNFANMPELHWAYGYWYVWGIMLAVGVVLVVYFKRRRWL
jgi:magnesium transporter